MNVLKKIGLIAATALILTGCATSRGVLDLKVPDLPNPASAQTVKIMAVADKRVFEIKPKKPSIPSLQNDEINDPKITRRAVARKRNGFGAALGDILLPEGQTVEQLTRAALVNALRDSGYRVVAAGEPGYDTATPVSAEVQQFWAWMTPGFWEIKLRYNAQLQLNGDWPLNGENRIVTGDARYSGAIASSSEWREVINNGIIDLIKNLKSTLKKASS
ncbi:MAG: putative lipoprotein YajG [Paracoccaceae bacterium]|jgi:uncharacterized lipoprotein YajG